MKFEHNCGNCLNTRMCKIFEVLREYDIIDDKADFVCGFYQDKTFKIFKEEFYYTTIPSIPSEPFITNVKDSITPYAITDPIIPYTTVTYTDTKEQLKNDN